MKRFLIALSFISFLNFLNPVYADPNIVVDSDGVSHYSGLAPLPDNFHEKIKAKGLYAQKEDLLFDEELPESYTPLTDLLGFIPDYSQGNYGTCYAFAGAYTIFLSEAINLSKLNHGYAYAKELVDEYMQSKMFAPNVGITACTEWSNGGWYFELFDNWTEKGGAYLSEVPYSGSGYRRCNFLDSSIKGVEYRLLEKPTASDIKRAVMKFGAVAVAVHSSCLSKSSSVGACKTNSYNHAVVIVGWTKTHWIIQNSWDSNATNIFWYINQQSNPYNPTYVVVKDHTEKIVPIPDPDPEPTPTPVSNTTLIIIGVIAFLIIGAIIIFRR